MKENLYEEFEKGEVLYDDEEDIEVDGAEDIAIKYYDAIFYHLEPWDHDTINGISKIENGYIFKIGDSINRCRYDIVKYSINELEQRLIEAKNAEEAEKLQEFEEEKAIVMERIQESKKKIANNEIKEKYLIVSKIEKEKVSKVKIFKDIELDSNIDVLNDYEDMTSSMRFKQDLVFLSKKEFEEKQKEINIQNKKIKDKDKER